MPPIISSDRVGGKVTSYILAGAENRNVISFLRKNRGSGYRGAKRSLDTLKMKMEAAVKSHPWLQRLAVAFSIGLLLPINLRAEELREELQKKEETAPSMAATIHDGMAVQIDYTLTVDGSVVDSSEGREPLRYIQGQGQLIPGLERQLDGLSTGYTGEFTVSPEEAYGAVNTQAFIDVSKDSLSAEMNPQVGMVVSGTSKDGRPIRARIHAINEKTLTLDLNHPLAGKTLLFKVKVVSISPQ